jgi:hypothetical protein
MVSVVREKFLYYTGKPVERSGCPSACSQDSHCPTPTLFVKFIYRSPDTFTAEITNRQMGSLAEAFSNLFLQWPEHCGVCEVTQHAPTVTSCELLERHTKLLHFGKLCA